MRKREVVEVPEWGKRDKGKSFLITEWPAATAERWGIKALLAYNRGGGNIDPDAAIGAGMEGIFFLGVQAFLRGKMEAEETIPILDELLDCVKIVRDPKARNAETGDPVATPIVSDDDIQEVQTRMWLRSEVVRVHTGFSPAAAVSNLISLIMTPAASRGTQTSQT